MADALNFFNEYLPGKLAGNAELAQEINAIYVFEIEGAGSWTVDLTGGEGGKVTEGGHDESGCTVSAAKEDFETLLDNPAQGMMLFTMGKLRVTNVGLALSLQKILA